MSTWLLDVEILPPNQKIPIWANQKNTVYKVKSIIKNGFVDLINVLNKMSNCLNSASRYVNLSTRNKKMIWHILLVKSAVLIVKKVNYLYQSYTIKKLKPCKIISKTNTLFIFKTNFGPKANRFNKSSMKKMKFIDTAIFIHNFRSFSCNFSKIKINQGNMRIGNTLIA